MIYTLKSNRCSFTFFCMVISLVFGQNKFDSQLLTGGYRNDGNHHSWIYFTDKGLKTEADLEVALQLSMYNLNERTKQRRSKTRLMRETSLFPRIILMRLNIRELQFAQSQNGSMLFLFQGPLNSSGAYQVFHL